MESEFKLFWTEEAIDNLASILAYLKAKWTQKEIDHFKIKLSKQLDLIVRNPELFPVSEISPRLRRAVLSVHTTVYYELSGKVIYLVYLFNNYRDPDKIH